MQITSICNSYYNHPRNGKLNTYKAPSFGEWYRYVRKKPKSTRGFEAYVFKDYKRTVEDIEYRNNTGFFRNGDELPRIFDAIVNLHKDTPHIHTTFYGCSNCAEIYSVYMYLLSKYGMNILSKFKPFNAMDIDRYAIRKAKAGAIPVSTEEFYNIQKYTNNRFNDFFHGEKFNIPNEPLDIDEYFRKYDTIIEHIFGRVATRGNCITEGRVLKLKEEHFRNINYSVGDLMKNHKNIEPRNSVIGLRDTMPYLKNDEIITLATNLGKRLKKDSCLIFGEYDFNPDRCYDFCLDELFVDNGFEKVYTGAGTSFLFKKI